MALGGNLNAHYLTLRFSIIYSQQITKVGVISTGVKRNGEICIAKSPSMPSAKSAMRPDQTTKQKY
jgi:hypothetical protein